MLALRCSHYPLMYLFLKFLKTPSVGRQTARNFAGTVYSGCPMAYTKARCKVRADCFGLEVIVYIKLLQGCGYTVWLRKIALLFPPPFPGPVGWSSKALLFLPSRRGNRFGILMAGDLVDTTLVAASFKFSFEEYFDHFLCFFG